MCPKRFLLNKNPSLPDLIDVLLDFGVRDPVLLPVVRRDPHGPHHELLPPPEHVLAHLVQELPQRVLLPQLRVEAEHLLAPPEPLRQHALALARPDPQRARGVLLQRPRHGRQALPQHVHQSVVPQRPQLAPQRGAGLLEAQLADQERVPEVKRCSILSFRYNNRAPSKYRYPMKDAVSNTGIDTQVESFRSYLKWLWSCFSSLTALRLGDVCRSDCCTFLEYIAVSLRCVTFKRLRGAW